MPDGNVSTLEHLTVDVERITLDPALQCRVAVDEEIVAEYAAAMKGGDGVLDWPPVDIVRVVDPDAGDQLLLVDGWHRVLAAQRADIVAVPARVATATRRDALLAAVRANGRHGLRRSNDDKRRAVGVLLQDAEWCAMSNRELAELAAVSHAYVGQIRRHYGLGRGERLDAETIERIDGDLPPAWKALHASAGWARDVVLDIRRATELEHLRTGYARAHHSAATIQAVLLRLQELSAGNPWPWPEDADSAERQARADALDDVEDLERALLAERCPGREQLWYVWDAALKIPEGRNYTLDQVAEKIEGRRGLELLLAARRADLEAEEAARPERSWEWRDRVEKLGADEQVEALRARGEQILDEIQWMSWGRHLHPAALEVLRGFAERSCDCSDPRCPGFVRLDEDEKPEGSCYVCAEDPDDLRVHLNEVLEDAAKLVMARVPLVIEDVVIDEHALEVLRANRDALALRRGEGAA